jgi:hypothetical protein
MVRRTVLLCVITLSVICLPVSLFAQKKQDYFDYMELETTTAGDKYLKGALDVSISTEMFRGFTRLLNSIYVSYDESGIVIDSVKYLIPNSDPESGGKPFRSDNMSFDEFRIFRPEMHILMRLRIPPDMVEVLKNNKVYRIDAAKRFVLSEIEDDIRLKRQNWNDAIIIFFPPDIPVSQVRDQIEPLIWVGSTSLVWMTPRVPGR